MNVRTPYQGFPPAPSLPPQPAQAEPSTREKIARFKTIARRALAYWKVSLLVLLVGGGISLWMAITLQLSYRSECTILFKPAPRSGDGDDGNPVERSKQIGAKLKDVLTTRTRLETLIRKYNLYPKIVDARGIVDGVEEMRLHIGFRARDSETFVISFENESPNTSKDVASALADSMIAEFTTANLNSTKQEADFLAKQEERSGGDFENASKALATFITLHPEFAMETKASAFGVAGTAPTSHLPTTAPGPGAPAQTSDPQLAVLYREKARIEAEIRNDNAAGSPAPSPGGGDSIAKLTVQRDQAAKVAAAAASDLADKRTRLTDEHPDVITAKMTADAAARQLHQAELALAQAQAAQAGAANPYETPAAGDATLLKRVAVLNGEIAARQEAVKHAQAQALPAGTDASSTLAAFGETNELVQLETEWQRLLSVLHDTRMEHEDLQHRLERARLSANQTESAGGDQMAVIDPAYKPMRPSKGGRTKTAMTGGIVTLILALAYAFSRVVFSDTLIDSADIEALQVVPVLGIPRTLVLRRTVPTRPPPSPPRQGQEGDDPACRLSTRVRQRPSSFSVATSSPRATAILRCASCRRGRPLRIRASSSCWGSLRLKRRPRCASSVTVSSRSAPRGCGRSASPVPATARGRARSPRSWPSS